MGERAKVRNLVRFVALFVAVPTLTIGATMAVWDPVSHSWHMVLFLILGAAALGVMALAPRLAARWVPEDADAEGA
ncbi:MAG: hypothetical protein QOD77_1710 [Thermoplasmata archaeon]|jgi:hypothetical protein|nr:hypothetical protein [Thermoplasmata archaeon]